MVKWLPNYMVSSRRGKDAVLLALTMQQLNLIEFFDKNGRILQHTELTISQRNILKKLKIKPPKRVLKVDLEA